MSEVRLIDANALKQDLRQYFTDGVLDGVSAKLAFNQILHDIDNAPTVETDIEVIAKDAYEQGYTDGWKERFGEPNERPQGEWIDYDNTFYKCPDCGYLLEKCCPHCQNKVILPKGGAE